MSLVDDRPRTVVYVPNTSREVRRAPRWPLAVLTTLLGLLILVALLPRRGAPTPAQPAPSNPGQHTRQGAANAAVAYVAAYGSDALFDPTRRHQLISRIADPGVELAMQRSLDADIPMSATQLGLEPDGNAPAGQELVVRTVPVGVNVTRYAEDTADVAVWTTGLVGLVGSSSTHPVSSSWSTATVSLRWDGTSWKWLSFSQVDGPTPVIADQVPSGSGPIGTANRDFAEPAYAR